MGYSYTKKNALLKMCFVVLKLHCKQCNGPSLWSVNSINRQNENTFNFCVAMNSEETFTSVNLTVSIPVMKHNKGF